jgi:glycosyltransferase involved in cell wall biosynthesis
MNLTVCQFNDSYFPVIDGSAMTAHHYSLWLNGKYGRCVMVAPKVNEYKDNVEYKVHRFKSVLSPGMNPFRSGLPLTEIRFKKKIRKIGFDILHAHGPFISGHLAVRLARKIEVPLVATFHTDYSDDYRNIIRHDLFVEFVRQMTLDFYQSADMVWVPNRRAGLILREKGFNGAFQVVPPGTDFSIPDRTQHLRLRKRGLELLDADANGFVMLFVGQLRWEKNLLMILESMKILMEEGKTFRMVFVGEGYAIKEMQKRVRQMKLTGLVTFMGLISDRLLLQQVYAAADLFLFPSLNDTAPLVLQEAAAFSVPSMVVRNSAPSDGILDGVNGFLSDPSATNMAFRISELMKNPEMLKKAGAEARKSIYRSWESVVDDVYQRYLEVIRDYHEQRTPALSVS